MRTTLFLLFVCVWQSAHGLGTTIAVGTMGYAAIEQRILHFMVPFLYPTPHTVLNGTEYVRLTSEILDTDGDGILSFEEVRDNDPATPYLGPNAAQQIYDYMDSWPGTSDGVVHASELMYQFNSLDANGDGLLPESEYKAEFVKILQAGARLAGIDVPVGK